MPEGYSFWDREVVAPQHISWLEEPVIHEYANALIGGGEAMWPMDWFERWLGGRRFQRALSIGCGSGALERDLVRRDLVRRVDAFDGSVASLRLAQAAAADVGIGERIRYFAADFNRPVLPRRTYDLVLFHQSAHHVAKLEKLFRAVLRSMTGNAVLYLDEYVGPSRFEWCDELIEPHRKVYRELPSALRTLDDLAYPIQIDDPSEAFRSSEIEPQLAVGFKTIERRPYGGTLLSVVYPYLRRELIDRSTMEELLATERRLMDGGVPSYYAVLVLRPRRGLRRLYASAHYFTVPKLKR